MKSVRKTVLIPYDKYERWKQHRCNISPVEEHTEIVKPLYEDEITLEKSPSLSDDTILTTIPKIQKGKARALLNFIHHSTDISWNDLGEIVIQGRAIPHSHITDLIRDTVGNYKRLNPVGKREFIEILNRNNIPKSLLHYTQQHGLGASRPPTPPPPGMPIQKRPRSKPEKVQWMKF